MKDTPIPQDRAHSRRGSNQSGMRAHNERLVLSLIREAGGQSKADIARQTELSAQTVSVIMRSLEQDALIRRGSRVRGKIGQPSVPFEIAPDGAYFFGLKIGRRSFDLVLTDFMGTVLFQAHRRHPYPTPEGAAAFATDEIALARNTLPESQHDRIAGLGIALPFQLWDWADTLGVGSSEMLRWRDYDIAADFTDRFEMPVIVRNDATTACGAELVFGQGTKADDFLYIFVGAFIGAGLVLDGALYQGPSGNAAALGSLPVVRRDGTMCQLVDVASLLSLEEPDSAAARWATPDHWSVPKSTFDAWVAEAARGIAHAIISTVCVIDLDQVFIDGWMPSDRLADLVEAVRDELARAIQPGIRAPAILCGTIGPHARELGAASLPLSEKFLVDRNAFRKGPRQ